MLGFIVTCFHRSASSRQRKKKRSTQANRALISQFGQHVLFSTGHSCAAWTASGLLVSRSRLILRGQAWLTVSGSGLSERCWMGEVRALCMLFFLLREPEEGRATKLRFWFTISSSVFLFLETFFYSCHEKTLFSVNWFVLGKPGTTL